VSVNDAPLGDFGNDIDKKGVRHSYSLIHHIISPVKTDLVDSAKLVSCINWRDAFRN
jgi:hypothetical protein